MNNFRIYTSHHKPSAFLNAPSIIPIHVGKANNYNDIGCSGDDTGDNISYKNPYYCELTAQYWVWKNAPDSNYIGFMHYRRHLNFATKQNFEEDNWGVVCCESIDQQYQEQFALTDEGISACLHDVDILVPKKWDVRAAGSKNNYNHYEISPYLHIKDYQCTLNCLLALYPEYAPAVEIFNDATDGYYTNMFVMRQDIFLHYSTWLFSILDKLEDNISFDNYNFQEKRVIGHIAERLLNIYLIHQLSQQHYRVKELQRTFVSNESYNGRLQPAFDKDNVPIVICFDDNYSMSAGALINSIVKNAHSKLNYDLVVLENNISLINKKRLVSLISGLENFSLRFFDVNAFSELKGVHVRAHFSVATYARLFIPRLFCEYERVIFIDADTIVECDLAALMDEPLGDDLVAAVKDIVMEGFVKFGAVAQCDRGVQLAGEYLTTCLKMTDPDKYFQAGLIIFNVARMVQEDTFTLLLQALKEQNYWFLDQDIMNKVFYGHVHYLPMVWNVYHGNGNTDDFFPNLKFSTYMRFLKARAHPKMIHYAGDQKPWINPQIDFFDNFANYVFDTPWQREFQERLHEGNDSGDRAFPVQPVLLQTKIKRRLMPLVNLLAPRGSFRRQVLGKTFYKIRRLLLG
jgi:lipopolysaccharide biosynthesis glycosyltransferase